MSEAAAVQGVVNDFTMYGQLAPNQSELSNLSVSPCSFRFYSETDQQLTVTLKLWHPGILAVILVYCSPVDHIFENVMVWFVKPPPVLKGKSWGYVMAVINTLMNTCLVVCISISLISEASISVDDHMGPDVA